jgi:hypothetical protein
LLDYLTRGSIELGLGVFGATIPIPIPIPIPITGLAMFQLGKNYAKDVGVNRMKPT